MAQSAVEDLNDLYLFARVVEAGGFAAAERSTGIPKSRLSRRIAALEEQLGVRLIQRSAHHFSVTEVGQNVYRHSRAIADEAQSVLTTVGEALSEPSGLIRISSSMLIGELMLASWLGEFTRRYPKVRVFLDLSNRFVDLLAERIDLVIRFTSTPLQSSDVIARSLGYSHMVLVASPDLIAAHGTPADIDDLSRFPAIAQGSLESIRPWVFKGADGTHIVFEPEARFVTDNVVALREAALQGAGLGQLPVDACRAALEAGKLVKVMDHRPSVGTGVYAMYPSRRGMSAAMRTLLDFLEERFRVALQSQNAA